MRNIGELRFTRTIEKEFNFPIFHLGNTETRRLGYKLELRGIEDATVALSRLMDIVALPYQTSQDISFVFDDIPEAMSITVTRDDVNEKTTQLQVNFDYGGDIKVGVLTKADLRDLFDFIVYGELK
jgi:hypothetical protein